MPLFKRTPFFLVDPPKDLDPKEKVFQIRFTKEIFRDYPLYVKRLNLYRQKVWSCKVSGKSNLTYEQALVLEQRAAEKAQQFPTELITPVLQMVQYTGVLNLTELVNKIYGNLQEDLFEGLELHAEKDGSEAACKILKIIDSGNSKMYEVGWIDKENVVMNTSFVRAEDLIRKKAPASRNILKLFIKESTSQNSPWVVHSNLAKKYDISTDPPKDMMNGEGMSKVRKRYENGGTEDARKRLKEDEKQVEVPIKYPMDDLLVKPAADDPVLSKKRPLSKDFKVPTESVGDLLMIWDFCMHFGKILCLSPFSLSDLENAVCHKETNVLLVEIHAALFHLLIEDEGRYFSFCQIKKRKFKISLVTWAEYLCDFLEMTGKNEFSSNISTVRRGHYGLVHTSLKLKILRELVDEAIATSAVREKLDELINQQQALAAEKRDIARKNKEEQKPNTEGVTENGLSRADTAQNDNENANGQLEGKKEKDKKNVSSSKMVDEKMNLRRHLEREMDKQSVQTNPLGKDRSYNRYWFFRREGRLFVESADSKEWGYYSTKEELDVLVGSLNIKGVRERALKRQLEKFYDKISNALEKRWKDLSQKMLLEEAALRRSSRVQAQPKESPSMSFLKYVNKWKEN